jgi:long-subunit fatty acid transport protein
MLNRVEMASGWAARAEDAATILTNPAGMTRLQEDDLLLGMQMQDIRNPLN